MPKTHKQDQDLARFENHYSPEPMSGCWLWVGRADRQGYGEFYAAGKKWRAHRWIYIRLNGPIAPDQHVLHACDNTSCVNPSHLHLGGHHQNMLEMSARDPGAPGAFVLDPTQVVDISILLRQGHTFAALARHYSVSPDVISSIAHGKSWSWLTGFDQQPIAGHIPPTRLSDYEASSMCSLIRDGATIKQAAERFGVSVHHARDVWRGRTRSCVTGQQSAEARQFRAARVVPKKPAIPKKSQRFDADRLYRAWEKHLGLR